MTSYPTWYAGQRVTAALLTDMQPYTITKQANESVTSSTTLQDDNHFLLPVVANATYTLEGGLFYDGEFNAGNLKATWTLPASASIYWSLNGPAVGGAAAYASNSTDAVATVLSVGTYGVGSTETTCSITGTITTAGTAGTAQFRWAQNSSHAVATTIYARSWMRLKRTA